MYSQKEHHIKVGNVLFSEETSQSSVATNLIQIKRSFGSGTERGCIVSAIMDELEPKHVAWLDVGIGDCVSTFRMVDSLRLNGFNVDVTGIDPELDSETERTGKTLGYSVHKKTLEDFNSDIRSFNFFNIRQSSYYLSNPSEQISRLVSSAKPGSLCAVTHWSSRCTLFRAHEYFSKSLGLFPSANSIEDLACDLKKILGQRASVELKLVEDYVNLDMWSNCHEIGRAAFNITTRRSVRISDLEKTELVKEFISTQHEGKSPRVNGVIFIRK